MSENAVQQLIEDATFEFSMGNEHKALEILDKALDLNPKSFDAWHAITEILYTQKDYEGAKEAGERARAICPEDIHINTSLSRIWVELGNKEKAEYFGAQARMLGWREEIQSPDEEEIKAD